LSCRAINLPNEITKVGVINHSLEKLDVFSPMLRLASKEEIVEADRRATKRIRFDYVGTGFEILSVNFVDDRWLSEKKKLDTSLQIFPFPILKAGAAIIEFGKFALLDHGAHGAIEDDNALAH